MWMGDFSQIIYIRKERLFSLPNQQISNNKISYYQTNITDLFRFNVRRCSSRSVVAFSVKFNDSKRETKHTKKTNNNSLRTNEKHFNWHGKH